MNLGKLIQTLTIATIFVSPVVKVSALEPSDLLTESNTGVEVSLNLPANPRTAQITTGTVGGGRRSPGNLCTYSDEPPLTVLMSHDVNQIELLENSNNQNSHFSLYWYLPQTMARTAELYISNDNTNDNFIYEQQFEIPQSQKGLVRLDLPSDISFEQGQTYRVEIALVCQQTDRSSDEYVWSFLQVLDRNEEQQLMNELTVARTDPQKENANSVQEALANVYLRHNLWHKAVGVLVDSSSSSNTSEPMSELLDYFGLDANTNLIGVVNENGFRPIE
jgi:hypothetical protein